MCTAIALSLSTRCAPFINEIRTTYYITHNYSGAFKRDAFKSHPHLVSLLSCYQEDLLFHTINCLFILSISMPYNIVSVLQKLDLFYQLISRTMKPNLYFLILMKSNYLLDKSCNDLAFIK